MQPNQPGELPKHPRSRAPTKKRRRRGPLKLRTVVKSGSSSRYDSRIFTARFRRLLPLDPSDLARLHRWFRDRIRWNKRGGNQRFAWYYGSIRVRTLGPLYGDTKVIQVDESDEWVDQWINLGVVNAQTGISVKTHETMVDKFDSKLDELDIRLESRAAYISEIKIEFFNLKPGQSFPNSADWQASHAQVRNI